MWFDIEGFIAAEEAIVEAMRLRFCKRQVQALWIAVCGVTLAGLLQAQADTSQTFTLRTSARTVLTDVLVLDKHGNSVSGLPKSAFQLLDNGKPVVLSSFEEHTGEAPQGGLAEDALPKDVYTNTRQLHMPQVVNIAVIDLGNLELPDQLYLSVQFEKLIANLPTGTPLAIYLNAGIHSVLLQDFTADHDRLLNAVHHALPHFPAPGRNRATGVETLHRIAMDFSAMQGRKNVLWFSGGASLSLNPVGLVSTPAAALRQVYDELEVARIAVYPIDARGLTTAPALSSPKPGLEYLPDFSVPVSNLASAQHGLMQDVATATGGLPYYNGNGLWQAALHDLRVGSEFYSLSYTPSQLKFDNKWHDVHVRVEGGPYTLSYRHGYFADGANITTPEGPRTRVVQGGSVLTAFEPKALLFRAEVQPAPAGSTKPGDHSPAPGQTRYIIRFLVPGGELEVRKNGVESEAVVGVAFIATDRSGRVLLQHAKQVTYSVDAAANTKAPNKLIPITQELDLNRGDTYLALLIWDGISKRLGTLSLLLDVP